MSDMTIDEATADTQVTGVEKLPASDGGTAKSVTVGQIRDFVVAELADADAADDVDVAEDGIFVSVDGEVKTLPAEKLAKAVINYACALTGIVGPNGNEIFIIDDSGTKKTITLAQVAAYITANADGFFSSLSSAGTMAASDKVIVKQGGSAKEGTLGNLAAFALGKFASYVASQSAVSTVEGTEKIAVVSGGVTKYVTLSQIVDEVSSVSTPSATTNGNIPTWGDSTGGSLGTGYAVGTSVRAQGTADNSTIPTEAAVRAAIGNGNVTGPNSTTENKIPQWGSTSKTLTDGLTLSTSIATPGLDSKVPTEKAVRSAISAAMENVGTGDVQKSGTPASGSIAEWTAAGKIEGGHTVTELVGNTGVNTAVPTEKAVRTAIVVATANVIAKSGTPASGKLVKFASSSTVSNGPEVVTSVGVSGSDENVPTEKAVRDALNAKAGIEGTPTSDRLAQWHDSASVKSGPSIVTTVAASTTAADTNIPTEKAVRTAIAGAIADITGSQGITIYDEVFIPAAAMIPSATNGATAATTSFTTPKRDTMSFGNTNNDSCEFDVVLPDSWNNGSFKAKFLWTAVDSAAVSGANVKWGLGCVVTPDGGSLAPVPDNFAYVTDAFSAASAMQRTDVAGPITPEGTAGSGNLLHCTVRRNNSNAPSSPLACAALLLGVVIQFARTYSSEAWS